MSELVADCPRCNSLKITFDVSSQNYIFTKYEWQNWFEIFSICRHCGKSTVFIISQDNIAGSEQWKTNGIHSMRGSVNKYFRIEGYVSLLDSHSTAPPEHLPEDIQSAFVEGARCHSIGCYNAAATMFRLCIDHASRARLPEGDSSGLTSNVRRSLGLRLQWLFENAKLPSELKELSACIKEDGNDGAHAGILQKEDADDILDFTFELLERLYTEPERLALAKRRREERRKPKG
jgi:hypothetical protein